MRRKLCSLIVATLAVFAFPAKGGDGLAPLGRTMSEELFQMSVYNALQKSAADSSKPSFTTDDRERMFLSGRFPLGNDLRHTKIQLGEWTLGVTHDQYGRSAGFTHKLGDNGVARFGLLRQNLWNMPNRTAAGASISFSW